MRMALIMPLNDDQGLVLSGHFTTGLVGSGLRTSDSRFNKSLPAVSHVP